MTHSISAHDVQLLFDQCEIASGSNVQQRRIRRLNRGVELCLNLSDCVTAVKASNIGQLPVYCWTPDICPNVICAPGPDLLSPHA